VKWLGGKTQLLPVLLEAAPDEVTGPYIEPFLGGGALFFAMHNAGRLRPACGDRCDGGLRCACPFPRAVLGDRNEELINLYRVVQDDVERLIGALVPAERSYQVAAAASEDAARRLYLSWRAEEPVTPVSRARRTVLINKLGFNGLYRVNKSGKCNVPFGKKGPKARVVDVAVLRAASKALRGVVLLADDWQEVLEPALGLGLHRPDAGGPCEGCGAVATLEATQQEACPAAVPFVFLDPPYGLVGKRDRTFTYGVTQQGLHERLIDYLAKVQAPFLLTNRDDPDDTNRKAYRAAKLAVTSTRERRSVSRDGAKRKKTDCLLVSNPERRQLRSFSVCSGSGHFDYGMHRAGIESVGFCEIDAHPRKVLVRHWGGEELTVAQGRSCVREGTSLPAMPVFDDLKRLAGCAALVRALPDFDVLVGGIPCQGFSLAGARRGRQDERWLWPWFRRIVELRRPLLAVIENVTGLRSSEHGAALGQILRDLVALGYSVEWEHIPAGAVGAPHIRDRIFLVARRDDRRTWLAEETRWEESARKRARKGDKDRPGDVPWGGWPRAGRVVPAGPGVGVEAGLQLFIRQERWPKAKGRDALWPWQEAAAAAAAAGPMLPTPRSQDAKHAGATDMELGRHRDKDLLHVRLAREPMWPTPRAAQASMYAESDETFNARGAGVRRETLARQAEKRPKMWPTPTASNRNEDEDAETWRARQVRLQQEYAERRRRGAGGAGNGAGVPLAIAAQESMQIACGCGHVWAAAALDEPCPTCGEIRDGQVTYTDGTGGGGDGDAAWLLEQMDEASSGLVKCACGHSFTPDESAEDAWLTQPCPKCGGGS